MKAVSLFTGVGGFDLAFERAGVETVLQAERDPHCIKVLERHWPRVERVSDVGLVSYADGDLLKDSRQQPVGRDGVDIIHGGFPCQPFSVAGRRRGAEDERDGWPEFRRVVSELRPQWVVAENVPGLLSIDSGRYFGRILTDLADLGFAGVAYAVLDAQHFGLAQRRRRVFIVAGPGRRAVEQVLAICEGCGGHPAESGAPGEGVAGSVVVRTANTGANGHGVAEDVAHTLDQANGQAVLAHSITASAGHHGHSSPRGDGSDNLVLSPTLTGGSGERGFRGDDGSNAYVLANPLGAHHGRHDLDHDTYVPEIVGTLSDGAHHGGGLNGQDAYTGRVIATGGVRRLTPLECSRLQGFPDDWLDGLGLADSHKYRQLGNAVAVPVVEWIARRIVAYAKGALQR
ncbi:MAG: DNA cytosine methyltransferase [Tepidiformaceae bacterium]